MRMMREIFDRYRSRIIAASVLFLASLSLGVAHAALDPSVPETLLSELQPLAEALVSLGGWKLAAVIFLNNSVKILGSIVLGTLFGIFPILSLLANGYLLGIIAQYHGPTVFLVGILPHGIFEIPALLLGAGAGIHLGWVALRRRSELKDETSIALGMFVRIIIPLLLIATLIETFLTPFIMDLFLS